MLLDIPRSYTPKVSISLTPLVDLVFLLVFFFMLTTTFTAYDNIGIDFAPAVGTTAKTKIEAAAVTVESRDRLVLEDEAYAPYPLRAALRARLKALNTTTVIVTSGPDATMQDLVFAIDQIHLAGAKQITFEQ